MAVRLRLSLREGLEIAHEAIILSPLHKANEGQKRLGRRYSEILLY